MSYITNSYFLNLTNRAIISERTDDYADITIETSIFSRVSASEGHGGAVLISSVGKVIQRKVVSEMCYTTVDQSRGQYCYVYPQSAHSLPNEVHEISITGYDEYLKVWEAMVLIYGSIIVSKLNISQHQLFERIYGIFLIGANSSISYLNVAYNNVTYAHGLVHDPPQQESYFHFLSKSNIFNNSVVHGGIVFVHSFLYVSDCNIVGHKGDHVFHTFDENSRMIVSNCYLDNPNTPLDNSCVNYSNVLNDEFQLDLKTDTYVCVVRFCSHADQFIHL